MKIKDMQVGTKVTCDLINAECSIRKTKTNKDYLQLTLSDGTDTLDGKVWDYKASLGLPEAKKVYTVTGIIGEYMGRKQITLSSLGPATDQSMERFTVTYIEDRESLWNTVMGLIGTIKDLDLREIVEGFYNDNKHILSVATSAKGVHHVGVGGNLQHSYEVALYADKLCKALNNELRYEQYIIDRDLCIAGALLHDIGKAWTYDQSTPAIDYNENGRWFDHIITGINVLNEWTDEHTVNQDKLRLLLHIVASHHGSPDKGSPVYPNFMEAIIVNQADSISATLNNVLLLNRKATTDLTDKAWTIGNYPLTTQTVIQNYGEV